MISTCLLALALTAAGLDESPGPDRDAYRAAAAAAGRDADAHVDLALWCEARGMAAEKTRHLARAVLLDPENARARGLLGQVKRDGRWMRPADAVRAVEDSPEQQALLREYFERRAQTRDKADDQYKLALWCEEKGLDEPMTAHLRRTLQLDPDREGAWRRLGFKKVGKRWVNPDVEAARQAARDARERADKEWTPRLSKLREALSSRDRAKRDDARAALAEIHDPAAAASVWRTFARGGNEARQRIAVEIFGKTEGMEASTALATLSVFSPHAAVRADAAMLLRQRDPREFAGLLASFLRDEVKYKVKQVEGPGSRGELLVEGRDANVRRFYTPAAPVDPRLRNLPLDAWGNSILRQTVGYAPMSGPIPMAQLAMSGPDRFAASPFMAAVNAANPAAGSLLTSVANRLFENGPATGDIPRDAVYQPWSVAFTPGQLTREMFRDSSAANTDRLGGPNVRALGAIYGRDVYIPVARMIAEANASAMVAQKQIENDVAAIEARNAPIRQTNERAAAVLKDVGEGADFGTDPEKWADWAFEIEGRGYVAQNSTASQPPPTIVEQVPIAFQPQAAPMYSAIGITDAAGYTPSGASCFAGGTLVRTIQGDRPIESILPGDLVLSQDVATGAFRYRAVLTAFHNPPNWTYAVDLGDGEVVRPTGIHRLWKAGEGWTMTRDLKPGDRLRTAGGSATVVSVEKSKDKAPVFNLLLADGDSYCVGAPGLIAHDNSLPAPVASPFDAVPDAAELAAAVEH